MSALISRNPFARTELHRQSVLLGVDTFSGLTCDWCGQVRHTKAGKPYLYRYHYESDGGRTAKTTGNFCCVSCFRAYHS